MPLEDEELELLDDELELELEDDELLLEELLDDELLLEELLEDELELLLELLDDELLLEELEPLGIGSGSGVDCPPHPVIMTAIANGSSALFIFIHQEVEMDLLPNARQIGLTATL